MIILNTQFCCYEQQNNVVVEDLHLDFISNEIVFIVLSMRVYISVYLRICFLFKYPAKSCWLVL